jgi:hypothetical protein
MQTDTIIKVPFAAPRTVVPCIGSAVHADNLGSIMAKSKEPIVESYVESDYDRGYREGFNRGVEAAQVYLAGMPKLDFVTSLEHPQLPYASPIERLELSTRAYNCLKREGVHTVRQLMDHTAKDLRNIRNFGTGCLSEVVGKLAAYGYTLRQG